MSFVRVGRSQPGHGKRPVRPKKAGAPKREWVSTVNDLSVHKLTPEEVSHRHEIHKSHNRAAAQWELKEKALRRRFRQPGSPAHLDHASLSIIREVFSDQLLLQDVLARSDRAMAIVKDLFGDAPRRQTGHPSVTMAPDCEIDSALPVVQRPEPPTQLSLLSQSMMDQQALNEVVDSEEDHNEEVTYSTASSDFNVVHRANLGKMKTKSQGRRAQRQRIQPNSGHQRAGDSVPVTPCTSGRAPDPTALNATVAVQRLRSRQSQSGEDKEEPDILVTQVLNPDPTLNQSGFPDRNSGRSSRTRKGRAECVSACLGLDGSTVSSLSGNQSSLGLLQAMLGQVEAELDSLGAQEPDAAQPPTQGPPAQKTHGLTGFSVALVSTLGRLAHLLRQREEEAQREAQERSTLEEEVKEQRGLIDALTAEILALREESAALQAGLQQRTAELEQRLDTMVLALGGLGLLGAHRDSDIIAADCQSGPPFPEKFPEQTQAPVCPAVLLSPPRQRDTWQPTGPVGYANEDVHGPVPCLSSLPSTSSQALTSDPLSSQLSREAMQAEIAHLNRQNDLIRAQLSQARGLGSGVKGSPNSSTDQRGSCPSSTGRTTPQAVGERMSGSSSTGRGTHQVQNTGGGPLTQQAVVHDPPNVSSVEQRLLELNRQSAAARNRLLELIEQQRQASVRVSPSVSPIPPSAFSPHTAGGGRTPEESMLLPAYDLLSQASGSDRRTTAGDLSSQSLGGETRDGKAQAEKLRQREGWFALSTHVR
ncbi:spindle and centriole-associated protein 1 [Polymixia lowei]